MLLLSIILLSSISLLGEEAGCHLLEANLIAGVPDDLRQGPSPPHVPHLEACVHGAKTK